MHKKKACCSRYEVSYLSSLGQDLFHLTRPSSGVHLYITDDVRFHAQYEDLELCVFKKMVSVHGLRPGDMEFSHQLTQYSWAGIPCPRVSPGHVRETGKHGCFEKLANGSYTNDTVYVKVG